MASSKPPLRLRIANTANTFARRLAGERLKEFVQPLSPLDGWSLNGTGRMNQYTTKPDQLGANLGWVSAANTAIIEPCASVPFKLFRVMKDGDKEEVTDDPLLELLHFPNLAFTGEQMWQLHYTYMNLTGESYILMMKNNSPFEPRRGQLPDALFTMPTHRIKFKVGANKYTDSTVELDKKVYPITAIIRDFNPDPGNIYYGRSIIAAAAQVIDLEDQMVNFNRRKFANDATPSLVFKTNEILQNDAYERLKRQITDEHTGVDNAGKPWIIENGDVTPIMLSNKDLEYLAGREFSMKQIFSMFKVSPAMTGQVENVNRANLEAGFYQHAVINTVPRVRQFVGQLNQTLVKPYNPSYVLDYENPVPEDIEAKLNAIKAGVGSWLTTDEGRDAFGMKPLPDAAGEHVVIVAGKTPATLDSIVAGSEAATEALQNPEDPDNNNDDDLDEDPDNNDPQDDKDKAVVPQKKKTLATKAEQPEPTDSNLDAAAERKERGDQKIALYRQRAEVYEESMLKALHGQFEAQRAEVLSKAQAGELHKAIDAATSRTKAQQQKRDWLAALLAWSAYTDTMRKALAPILYALVVETGGQAMQQVGKDPSQFDPTDLDVLNYSQHQAQQIAEWLNAETEKQLRASLTEGVNNDENDDQLRARVETVFGAALTYRAARIAATETTRAQGFADVAAWKQAGNVTGKVWLVESNNPCVFCQNLDGTVVELGSNFFEAGDIMSVSGQTRKVNDPVPYPPVHQYCQCVLMPVTG